jgi:hypothetical protein
MISTLEVNFRIIKQGSCAILFRRGYTFLKIGFKLIKFKANAHISSLGSVLFNKLPDIGTMNI